MDDDVEYVKENVYRARPLSLWWLVGGVCATAAALCLAILIDTALPVPLTRETAPKTRFIAENAYEHLVNLTSIGPRVAGSYENEVLGVAVVSAALRDIARGAHPQQRLHVQVHKASGRFAISFLDGMSNFYRDVQSVVARLSPAGETVTGGARVGMLGQREKRRALLINCHIDSVPDSPGASDDGAGCAVGLETLRALAAAPARPHDAVLLLNGAEENIMQASHAFITTHPWARDLRAFINVEACGAGGREVLFQAGPHDPWIMEVYAGAVPHPYASSLAQELFESGLVPGDTDFRIFRDFGKLSGVDLAWSSNGYVYHTALDVAAGVPRATLQRTGDNVLALAIGLLGSPHMESATQVSGQSVFFDVFGAYVVCVRGVAAVIHALLTLVAVAARIHLNAMQAKRQMGVGVSAWWRLVGKWWVRLVASQLAGAAAAATLAALLHASGARLAFYSRLWLLAPLYALPALCVSWWCMVGAWGVRGGWRRARLCGDACCAVWGVALALLVAARLRSAFLPLLHAALPAAADILATLTAATDKCRLWWWFGGAVLPTLQSCYLAYNWLCMFVPITGRAGDAPADVLVAILVSSLILSAFSWLLPFVVAAGRPYRLIYSGLAVSCLTALLVSTTQLGAPYTASRPQRLMVFHTRRTVHSATEQVQHYYWVPVLDGNTLATLQNVPSLDARYTPPADCDKYVYCGAPYYLPVISFISRGVVIPAPDSPLPRLQIHTSRQIINGTTQEVNVKVNGTSHIVCIAAPVAGWQVDRVNDLPPQPGLQWGDRNTYFISMHDARTDREWELTLLLTQYLPNTKAKDTLLQLSIAGHCPFGSCKLHPDHKQLLDSLPEWTFTTGWGIDLHILTV